MGVMEDFIKAQQQRMDAYLCEMASDPLLHDEHGLTPWGDFDIASHDPVTIRDIAFPDLFELHRIVYELHAADMRATHIVEAGMA